MAQLLVVAALGGCIEGAEPDIVVRFQVTEELGEPAFLDEVGCYGFTPGLTTEDPQPLAVLSGGADGIFTCTVSRNPEEITMRARSGTARGEMIVDSTMTETLHEIVMWRPAVTSDLTDDVFTVSWEPLLDGPDPTWVAQVGIHTRTGRVVLPPETTSHQFPLAGNEGATEVELFATFRHPQKVRVRREHSTPIPLPPTDPIAPPPSRDAPCQVLYRYESPYNDGILDDLVDHPGGECPLTDGSDGRVHCPEYPTTCDVIEGTLDLGEVVEVARVWLSDHDTPNLRDVELSEDGVTFTRADLYDPLPEPRPARYVRVRAPVFYEVSVFTAPAP